MIKSNMTNQRKKPNKRLGIFLNHTVKHGHASMVLCRMTDTFHTLTLVRHTPDTHLIFKKKFGSDMVKML